MDSTECSHELIFAGMCAYCGTTVVGQSDPNDESSFVSISHDTSALRATRKHAEKIHQEETQRLLGERRLSLIVDLDQTIVHAWDDPAIESWLVDESHPYHAAAKDIYRINLHDSPRALYLKLRPGTMEFLENAAKIFELHIYTAGSRSYADAVAQILDPKANYSDDVFYLAMKVEASQRTKDLKRLFPCDDAMVLIIDDRADVWRRVPNLIQVRKYEFYLGIGDINAPTTSANDNEKSASNKDKPDTSVDNKDTNRCHSAEQGETSMEKKADSDENGNDNDNNKLSHQLGVRPVPEDNDKELDVIWERLSKIHTAFYMLQDENEDEDNPLLVKADVKDVANGFRHRTLLGCTILFSGLIAVNESFEMNEYWLMAKECGAIVNVKPGTSKVHEAEDRGNIFIVSKEWLEESFYEWRRADEHIYALPDVEQPSISVEDRIAQAADAMVRSRNHNGEENTILKRAHSAIDDGNLADDSLPDDTEQKRSRIEESMLDEEEKAELLRLSPSSNAEEMQEKLRHCDWNSMMDDEEGEQLDTETEAEAWPDDEASSGDDDDNDNGNGKQEARSTSMAKYSPSSLTAYHRLEARLHTPKQSRRNRVSDTMVASSTTDGYRPSPLRHETNTEAQSNDKNTSEEDETDTP
ncbi:hypothetical protein BDF22DRAFT_693228, partial [Syncephalis plumigaleata]